MQGCSLAVLCAEVGLVPSKEGYHAIKLEGCEFLLATTADGKLDLSDVYVQVSDVLCLLLACILKRAPGMGNGLHSSVISLTSTYKHGCLIAVESNYQKMLSQKFAVNFIGYFNY